MVIKVPIIVSYNNKGTKQATKGIGGLEKSFKKMGLASKLSYAAAGTAALAFAKKSIAAALADQKQQVVLAKTLANVGESFATASVTKYIDSLQRATGVSEDQLRPAFNNLVTATQSATKAQDLLALSLDISAATGKSSESVAAALSKAYLGNNTALSKLGVGLTKTQLKSMTFEETTEQLSKLFAGQASATANTYAGQLAILGVAANEASETIGTALIESLVKLGGQNGAKDLATQMQGLADSTANVITGITVVIDYFKKLDAAIPSWLKTTINFIERFTPAGQVKEALKGLEALGAKEKQLQEQRTNNTSDRGNLARAAAIADKAAKAGLKNSAKDLAVKQKILITAKQSAANEKLSRMFDMDSIQLAAALQGKLSKEDEARVKALQALKTEDKNDDIKALEDLEAAKRQATFDEIARMKSVVEESKKSNAEIIADARTRIATIQGLVSGLGTGAPFLGHLGLPAGGAGATMAPAIPTVQDLIDREIAIDAPFMPGGPGFSSNAPAAPTSVTVNVNPTGSGFIGNQDDFQRVVQLALQMSNESGYSFDRAGA